MSGSLSTDEDYPDYPPPSFQEAMQASQIPSTSGHIQPRACSQVDASLSMSTQSFHSAAERRVESPPLDSPLSDNSSTESLQILDEDGRSRTPECRSCRCGSTRRLDDSDLRREVSIEHPPSNSPAPLTPEVSPTPTKKSHLWLAPLRTLIPSRLNSSRTDLLSPTSASAPVTPSAPSVRHNLFETASVPAPKTPTPSSNRTPLSPVSSHSFRKDNLFSRRLFSKQREAVTPAPSVMDVESPVEDNWIVVDRDEACEEPEDPRASSDSVNAGMEVMQPQVVRRPAPPRIRTDFSSRTVQANEYYAPAQATLTPAVYSSTTPGLTAMTSTPTMTPALATPTTATYMTAVSSLAPIRPSCNQEMHRPLATRRSTRRVVDSTFAPVEDSEAYWRNERMHGRVPEGVLIDLDHEE